MGLAAPRCPSLPVLHAPQFDIDRKAAYSCCPNERSKTKKAVCSCFKVSCNILWYFLLLVLLLITDANWIKTDASWFPTK